MLKANWQWKKAIASILGAFTLLVGAGGLVGCGFGGGDRGEADDRIKQNNNQRINQAGDRHNESDNEQHEDRDDDREDNEDRDDND